VICLSKTLYPELEDLVPGARCHILPNGVPDRCEGGGMLGKRPARPNVHVLFLSNMIPEKGPLDLLEALRMLRGASVPVRCTFVGPFLSRSFQERFEALVDESELGSIVTIAGAAYEDSRERHLADADVLAFPSYYGPEAFPLTLLEAMSYGIPVVAARVGGIPDIVDDGVTGFLVDPRKPDELAAKLRLLVENEELRIKMGMRGRTKYDQTYTLAHFVSGLIEILERSVAPRGAARAST
jgi:glycosyltransferase involved in cell wall biosynthesis